MNDNLTLDTLLKIKNKLTTTLYYATSDLVELGSVIVVKFDAQLKYPKYFVCHPDDLEQIKENTPAIKFIPLSEAPLQFSQPLMKYKTRWSP